MELYSIINVNKKNFPIVSFVMDFLKEDNLFAILQNLLL